MSWIQFREVRQALAGKDVLSGVSFQVSSRDRIGLVGENGSGKSTILKLMAGLLRPDAGIVSVARTADWWYVPQAPELPPGRSVLDETLAARPGVAETRARMLALELALGACEPASVPEVLATAYAAAVAEYGELGGYSLEQEARESLAALGLEADRLEQPVQTLSGGEQARVALAKALLAASSLLLLDEPDNHLDVAGLEWLERMLLRHRGAFVLVTHDRMLLERVADSILEIEDGQVTLQHGSYAAFLERKQERLQRQQADYLAQQRRVRALREAVDRAERHGREIEQSTVNFFYRKRAAKVARRAVTMRSRIGRQLDEAHRIDKPRLQRDAIRLELQPELGRATTLLRLEGLGKSVGGRTLFQDVDLELSPGQCVAVTGPNGAGKTTLLEVALGRQSLDAGRVLRAPGAGVYYCDQKHGGLDPDLSAREHLLRDTDLDETQSHYLLSRLLLHGQAVHSPVSRLSGGERTRLVLALLMNARAELLVLDEPTNHLDLAGSAVLEEALCAFQGAILLVSHDRQLVGAVATEVHELRAGRLWSVDVHAGRPGHR